MAYLNQGVDNQYAVVLEDNNSGNKYKIVMSADGTVVTSEKTSLQIGVYQANSDERESDQNIANAIVSLYKKPLKKDPTTTIGNYILNELVLCSTSYEFGLVTGVPKMTKALATSLSSIKEAMTFNYSIDSKTYDFLCFGYRRIIAESLVDHEVDPIFVFSDRFFTGASFETRFKPNNIFMYRHDHSLLVTNDKNTLDKVSIVMSLDWHQHTEYVERSLVED